MGDWLAREGWMIVNWWLVLTLAGAAALPLGWRFLGSLPDRGVLLARPLGLLTIGFVYWLLNTLGFLRNEPGSIVFAALIVLSVGVFALFRTKGYAGERESFREWWQRHKAAVIAGEILFIVLLLAWTTVRAHQNHLASTERPMDIALLHSVIRSPTFPPADPWLSGYAISYYYFGYVIGAMVTMASGVFAGHGYNIWTATLFALAGASGFAVVYNLVRVRGTQQAAIFTACLGAFTVAIMGNYLTPLVDEGWYGRTISQETLDFWDVRDRQTPLPSEDNPATDWVNEGTIAWGARDGWWWNSARIFTDRVLPVRDPNTGEYPPGKTPTEEVIAEPPIFSYILGDNHPHVMTLPFTILAMGIGLSIALNRRAADTLLALFCGVTIGGLIFLNTWDAPTYIALAVAGEALRRYAVHRGRLTWDDGMALVSFLGLVVGVMLVAYFPFLVSFGSQLGGVLPNLYMPTATQQLLLMFGALFLLTIMFVAVEAWRGGQRLNIKLGILITGGIFGLIIAVLLLLVLLGSMNMEWTGPQQIFLLQNPDEIGAVWAKRAAYLLTPVLLLLGLFFTVSRLFTRPTAVDDIIDSEPLPYSIPTGFALLMIAAALLLVLVPDYLYLRDGFSTRMNTVFKFYYQAWALLAVACAYGVWNITSPNSVRPLAPVARIVLGILALAVLIPGLDYPLRATTDRMFVETGRLNGNNTSPLTLNGAPTLTNPNDYQALMCLYDLTANDPTAVVAEYSHPGSYHYFQGAIGSGRLAGITGLSTILGWQGHESQWRGRGYTAAVGSRREDIVTLYTDLRLDVVQPIIDKYGVDYIVYGAAERAFYGTEGEVKFLDAYEVVCEAGDTRIFKTRTLPLGRTARINQESPNE